MYADVWIGSSVMTQQDSRPTGHRLGNSTCRNVAIREDQGTPDAISVEQFSGRDRYALIVAPEGTRSGAEQWKTGFYHIAHRAGVPIVIATADYRKKEIAFPAVFSPTGDVEADLPVIQAHYARVHPRHPDKLSAPLKALRSGQDEP